MSMFANACLFLGHLLQDAPGRFVAAHVTVPAYGHKVAAHAITAPAG
jgi:hypothetical protein